MTSMNQERWQRVKDRLRTELGDDVFSSWFGRMELEAVDDGAVRLSVPTRFLRNCIQAHYSERVLSKWQAEGARRARSRSTASTHAPASRT
jgi:chromosomal replication initiator protein